MYINPKLIQVSIKICVFHCRAELTPFIVFDQVAFICPMIPRVFKTYTIRSANSTLFTVRKCKRFPPNLTRPFHFSMSYQCGEFSTLQSLRSFFGLSPLIVHAFSFCPCFSLCTNSSCDIFWDSSFSQPFSFIELFIKCRQLPNCGLL